MNSSLNSLRKAFADATDRWKIDGQGGLKGLYLHSPTDRLFSWDQPKGVLYEFDASTGNCHSIWSAANPGENAEIWTILPLPPTDPAAGAVAQEDLPSIQVAIPEGATAGEVLQVTTLEGTEVQFVVPPDATPGQLLHITYTPPEDFLLLHILENREDVGAIVCDVTSFTTRLLLNAQNLVQLKKLPYEGQAYVERNYESQPLPIDEYLAKIGEEKPWEQEYRLLRVDATGAILGSCLPEFTTVPGLAQAQCQIITQKDKNSHLRWYVRDLESATGSFLDGRSITTKEPGCMLRTNCVLDLGNQVEMIVEVHEVDARGASTNAGKVDINSFRRTVAFQETLQELRERKRQREEYNDRAELRRVRVDHGRQKGAAVNRLLDQQVKIRENHVVKEEVKLNEEESRTVTKHMEEAGMAEDGSFLGAGTESGSRGGIGFASEADDFQAPRSYSKKDASKYKTQKRFEKSGNKR